MARKLVGVVFVVALALGATQLARNGSVEGRLAPAWLDDMTAPERICSFAWGALAGGFGHSCSERSFAVRAVADEYEIEAQLVDIEIDVETPEGRTEAAGLVARLRMSRMFQLEASDPTIAARRAFIDMAKIYADTQQALLIVGHTDSTGEATFNQALSEARARAVAQIFVGQGVPQGSIFFQGVGESQPLMSNESRAGRVANRRVEVVEIESVAGLLAYQQAMASDPRFLRASTRTAALGVEARIRGKGPRSREIDFEGGPASYSAKYLSEALGDATNLWAQARALVPGLDDDEGAMLDAACIAEEPRRYGDVYSLNTGSTLSPSHEEHEVVEFLPGLYETAWVARVGDHLVTLSPVGVLRKGARTTTVPKLKIYRRYSGPDQPPDFDDDSIVQTYEGENGILYRIYPAHRGAPVECIDLVLPKRKPFVARAGRIYYGHGMRIHQVEFQPVMLVNLGATRRRL
ncbi:MAG: OmpA family protein [Myxococcota bacterium]